MGVLAIFFIIFVLTGFLFHFLSSWPVTYASRIAWGAWLIAAILWAVERVGTH